MSIEAVLGIIGTILGLILTTAIIHFTITNRNKTKADNITLLWERIDSLDEKNKAMSVRLDEEISKRDEIIKKLLSKIGRLEARLRDYGIPLPEEDDDETQPIKPIRSLGMKK